MTNNRCRVAVIGAGPSGLAVATELKKSGVDDVVLLERESAAGGIPRHCGHSPFGMREFHRVLSGAKYAQRLTRQSLNHGVDLRLNSSVTAIDANGELHLSTREGEQTLQAERVVICTGARETPRSARLVSGSRPAGILTTGALQSMVYLKHRLPFKQPVIIGSELVAFSAYLTCRLAGIKPVAMLEASSRVTTWKMAALLPRLLGTDLQLNSSLEEICGEQRVSAVKVKKPSANIEELACDGVIFSGDFVAESSLARSAGLQIDTVNGNPLVDQFGRSSNPNYFVCGNIAHPVDTAGWCWAEAVKMAGYVKASLDGRLASPMHSIDIVSTSDSIKYFTPQKLALTNSGRIESASTLQLRFNHNRRGKLILRAADRVITSRTISAKRERRVLLPIPTHVDLSDLQNLMIDFEVC